MIVGGVSTFAPGDGSPRNIVQDARHDAGVISGIALLPVVRRDPGVGRSRPPSGALTTICADHPLPERLVYCEP